MFGNFAVGTAAYVYAGLLEPLAADLGVSVGLAGQLATAYAVAYAVAAPILVILTARFPRKTLLVSAMLLFTICNIAMALAPTFSTLMGARVGAALAAALYTPISLSVAAFLAKPERRGLALALTTGGISLAFVIGIPLGTVLGGAFGWRTAFYLSTGVAALALLLVLFALPNIDMQQRSDPKALQVLRRGDVLSLLALTMLAFVSGFCVFAFIGPVVRSITGLGAGATGSFILAFGAASVVGTVLGGVLADRTNPLRSVNAAVVLLVTSNLCFSLFTAVEGQSLSIAGAVLANVLAGLGVFALIPLVQYLLVKAAPEQSSIVLGFNASMLFLGQGLGAVLGGVVLSTFGVANNGYVAAGIALIALIFTAVGPIHSLSKGQLQAPRDTEFAGDQ